MTSRISGGDVTSGSDEFQLPMLGLYADLEMGCGSVRLPDEFLNCSNAVQLEIIDAWQRSLARYRHEALRRLQDELAASHPGLGTLEQLALLHSTCAVLGVEIPAGWPAVPGPP